MKREPSIGKVESHPRIAKSEFGEASRNLAENGVEIRFHDTIPPSISTLLQEKGFKIAFPGPFYWKVNENGATNNAISILKKHSEWAKRVEPLRRRLTTKGRIPIGQAKELIQRFKAIGSDLPQSLSKEAGEFTAKLKKALGKESQSSTKKEVEELLKIRKGVLEGGDLKQNDLRDVVKRIGVLGRKGPRLLKTFAKDINHHLATKPAVWYDNLFTGVMEDISKKGIVIYFRSNSPKGEILEFLEKEGFGDVSHKVDYWDAWVKKVRWFEREQIAQKALGIAKQYATWADKLSRGEDPEPTKKKPKSSSTPRPQKSKPRPRKNGPGESPAGSNPKEIGAGDLLKTKFKTFQLGGEVGEFLGELERYKTAILLTGDPGAGKSYFSFAIAKAFIEAGFKSKYFSLEEGIGSTVKKKVDRYKLDNRLTLSAYGTLDEIKGDAKAYDVILIDSFTSLGVKSIEFNRLREAYPDTIFVCIFQKNSKGGARGGPGSTFDATATINVSKQGKERVATMTKTRYGTCDWKINTTTLKIISKTDQ